MKEFKNEKGITLVALIITIVVLLILAAVAIGTLKNSDIIGHAQNATNSYKVAEEKEAIDLALSTWKLEEIKPNKTFKQVITEELGERVEFVEGSDDGPLTVKFKSTGNTYTITKNGINNNEDETIKKFKTILDKFFEEYIAAQTLTDETEKTTAILAAENKMKTAFEAENATFYYTVDLDNTTSIGGLIMSHGTKSIFKVIIEQDEEVSASAFEIIESDLEYNEWTQKEFNYIEFFKSSLTNQDFVFEGNTYKIISEEDNKCILYNPITNKELELELQNGTFLFKSMKDLNSTEAKSYVLIINGVEREDSDSIIKLQDEGKYVWYDYNSDGTKEKWIILYNNEEQGLQIVSSETIGTMTFGDVSGNVSAIIKSFNDAYNNVNEKCRSLVTENIYKESVRFFESKTVDTDNVSYDTVTYKLDGVEYEVKEINETFNDDIRKAQKLGISIPEEHFVRANIRNYSTIGGVIREYLEITKVHETYMYREEYNVLAVNKDTSGTMGIYTASTATASILPVVKLKENVIIDKTTGEGTVDSPYSLKISN